LEVCLYVKMVSCPRITRPEIYLVLACFVISMFMVFQVQNIHHYANVPGDILKNTPASKPTGRWEGDQICSSVDVVYTWVNGSDPKHREAMRKYGGGGWDGGYRDYGVIRYSARSVAKFMPWVRNIVIVTNGQVPDWVDTSSPRVRIVTHDQIFENKDDLPTFNSNAIEANLRNIPDIAPCFLYLNDDMFLGSPVSKDTFFDEHGNLKLSMSRGFIAPMYDRMRHNLWHKSVGTSNDIINSYYYPDSKEPVKHNYVAHVCYFMRTDILKTIGERWHNHIERTSSHRFRQGDDTAMPFMQANVALEEFGASKEFIRSIYGTWTTDKDKNTKFWNKVWSNNNICVCMNDQLDNSKNSELEIQRLQQLFEEKFPEKSFIEK